MCQGIIKLVIIGPCDSLMLYKQIKYFDGQIAQSAQYINMLFWLQRVKFHFSQADPAAAVEHGCSEGDPK